MVRVSVEKIRKLIPNDQVLFKGKIVLGTVAGDIHDIGKNLVKIWMSTQGFEVVDIGVDCPVDTFIDRAIEEKANLIGASCLLTTLTPEQKKLVERMKERGVRGDFLVIIGGAAVDAAYARDIEADGFGSDLQEAAEVAISLLAKTRGHGHDT